MKQLTRATAAILLLAMAAGAIFFAFWAYKFWVLATLPKYLQAWQSGNWSRSTSSDIPLLATLLLLAVCVRSAWVMLLFLRQRRAHDLSFRSLLRANLF